MQNMEIILWPKLHSKASFFNAVIMQNVQIIRCQKLKMRKELLSLSIFDIKHKKVENNSTKTIIATFQCFKHSTCVQRLFSRENILAFSASKMQNMEITLH